VVSNWGGRPPADGDKTAKSDNTDIVVDAKGAPASGTVSLIYRQTGASRHVEAGVHPTAIVVDGATAYVACAMSDTAEVIDIEKAERPRSIPIRVGERRLIGSMPNALAKRGNTLLVADGGDNALAEIDLATNTVRGFRPVGFYPSAVMLSADG